ncbi:hypothetical protein Nans01_22430 [Nocardiopsis ansamitocini]|uniref:Uncharacterized protein n=1 Tax=Nocardiopsis ansamitocini TaxID=1670832 RepID=A0A9W6P6C7_9ACTN|nr:hypothetical protein Nans01_22430 [Nocardiopsis ansamitocini]
MVPAEPGHSIAHFTQDAYQAVFPAETTTPLPHRAVPARGGRRMTGPVGLTVGRGARSRPVVTLGASRV